MKKSDKIILGISIAAVMFYIVRCICTAVMDGFHEPIMDYFGLGYMGPFGVVLLLGIFGIISVVVQCISRRRSRKGKEVPSPAYRASFYFSFLPFVMLLTYSLYCVKYGYEFMWSVTYGWEAFKGAFFIIGLIFCIIPVFPFCVFWQILYIIKRIRARKAAKSEPVLFVSERG